jgi:hypothetical protein
MRDFINILLEAETANVINHHTDFVINYRGKSAIIPSADSMIEKETNYVDSPQLLKWCKGNLVNWIIRNYDEMPETGIIITDDLGSMLELEQYDGLFPDNMKSSDFFEAIAEIKQNMPPWARNGRVLFPHNFGSAIELSNDEHMAGDFPDLMELFDYLKFAITQGTDISRMSVPEAVSNSDKWHNQKIKSGSGDAETIMVFDDGMKMVEIKTTEGLDYESHHCNHCIGKGTYDEKLQNGEIRVFSLRNTNNEPYVTIAVKNEYITELQGRNNTPPEKIFEENLVKFIKDNKLQFSGGANAWRRNFPDTYRNYI